MRTWVKLLAEKLSWSRNLGVDDSENARGIHGRYADAYEVRSASA